MTTVVQKIRAILIDDDPKDRNVLAELISTHCPEVELVKECSDPFEAMHTIKQLKPNAIFLDIRFENEPGMNGIEMLKTLKKGNAGLPFSFQTVFISKYDNRNNLMDAIILNACHFLVKPIVVEELKEAIRRLLENDPPKDIPEPDTYVIPPRGRKRKHYRIDNIIYFEAQGNCIDVITVDRRDKMVNYPLGKATELLERRNFVRVHRGFTVNIKHIKEELTGKKRLIMSNGDEVPVPQNFDWENLKC